MPADDTVDIRVAIKPHGSARERNRKAGDVGEPIGADLLQFACVVKQEAHEGNFVEGEGRLPVVVSHNANLSAPFGCRADGIIVADRLDGRIAFVEGDAVPSWICFYWKCI